MEQFGTLKRRTTDLMSNIPKPNMSMNMSMNMPSELPQFPKLADLSSKLPALPALPKLPAFAGYGSSQQQHPAQPTLKATWERIDVPPIPRSSHSVNIVAGNAYIFGGEVTPRQPVDNDMHVIVLPFSSAGADCYTVKAKPAPKPDPPIIPTVVEPTDQDEHEHDPEAANEKDLSEVPLASPSQEAEAAAAPSSSSKGKEPAHAAPDLGDVPPPRVGHATAVIGTRIFLFGGRGGPDMVPLEERGRVWVFDTKTHLWSYLDPYLPPTAFADDDEDDKSQHYPPARSYHSAAGVDQPREFSRRAHNNNNTSRATGPGGRGLKRTTTWTEWAQGDSNVVGTPQRPIVGNVANNSRDEDDEGFGTLLVHGGCLAEGRRAGDTWAFDVRSRAWRALPPAPGRPRGGAGLAVAGGMLWRFGGFNGEDEEGGQLDYLPLGVDESGGDVVLNAKDGVWKTVPAEQFTYPTSDDSATATTTTPLASTTEEEEQPQESAEEAAQKPLVASAPTAAEEQAPTAEDTNPPPPAPHWPGRRSVAALQAVTIGGAAGSGRTYLVLALGERAPSSTGGHDAAGAFWDDVWAYELARGPGAAASVMGAVSAWASRARSASSGAGAGTTDKSPQSQSQSEQPVGKWFKVEADEAYDDDDDDDDDKPAVADGPGPRGWFASAHMGELEERGVLLWGGVDGANRRLGDGWILRLGGDKREA